MSRAKKLIGLYASIRRQSSQISRMTSCWYVLQKTGLEWTEDEKRDLREAQTSFEQAKTKFDGVLSKKIGQAVTLEVRAGEWKT